MYRKILNTSKNQFKNSETESIALNSGTTSVENIFKGSIPKNHIKNTYVYPKLNPSSIINTSVNELCASVDDYNTYQTKNVDDNVLNIIKDKKLFGMIIPKKYGGLN